MSQAQFAKYLLPLMMSVKGVVMPEKRIGHQNALGAGKKQYVVGCFELAKQRVCIVAAEMKLLHYLF